MLVKEHWPTIALEEEKWRCEKRESRVIKTHTVFMPRVSVRWKVMILTESSSAGVDGLTAGWQHEHRLLWAAGSLVEDQMEEAEETAQLRQPKVQGELYQTLRKMCFCCSQSSHGFKLHMCISGFFVLFLCMCVLACLCCTQWSVHDQSTSCLVHFAFVQNLHGKEVFMCGTFWQMYKITTSWGELWLLST